jgi:hypothetical protein
MRHFKKAGADFESGGVKKFDFAQNFAQNKKENKK